MIKCNIFWWNSNNVMKRFFLTQSYMYFGENDISVKEFKELINQKE